MLAPVHSEEENDFITSLAQNSTFWIDGNRNCSRNCFWQWSGLNQKISYFNWRKGEPNNYGPGPENCILVLGTGYIYKVNEYGVWNDVSCYARYGFVCSTAVSFI